MTDMGEALDYEGEIEAGESEFEAIPAGTYDFEVEEVGRKQYNGGDKMGPCPIAAVRCRIVGGAQDGRVFFCDVYLNSKVSWKIRQFFVCLGMHPADAPKEQKVRMDWSRAVGRRGRVRLGTRTYDGREYTDVKEWLKPSAPAAPAAQAAPSVPTPGMF